MNESSMKHENEIFVMITWEWFFPTLSLLSLSSFFFLLSLPLAQLLSFFSLSFCTKFIDRKMKKKERRRKEEGERKIKKCWYLRCSIIRHECSNQLRDVRWYKKCAVDLEEERIMYQMKEKMSREGEREENG